VSSLSAGLQYVTRTLPVEFFDDRTGRQFLPSQGTIYPYPSLCAFPCGRRRRRRPSEPSAIGLSGRSPAAEPDDDRSAVAPAEEVAPS